MGDQVRSFRDLVAWQKGISLCKTVYRISAEFPDRERFGLISQIRRAAVSVPANIAEGYGRRGKQELIRFLDIARGSLCEVETFVVLAHELGFLTERQGQEVVNEIHECARILFGLIRSLEAVKGNRPRLEDRPG